MTFKSLQNKEINVIWGHDLVPNVKIEQMCQHTAPVFETNDLQVYNLW